MTKTFHVAQPDREVPIARDSDKQFLIYRVHKSLRAAVDPMSTYTHPAGCINFIFIYSSSLGVVGQNECWTATAARCGGEDDRMWQSHVLIRVTASSSDSNLPDHHSGSPPFLYEDHDWPSTDHPRNIYMIGIRETWKCKLYPKVRLRALIILVPSAMAQCLCFYFILFSTNLVSVKDHISCLRKVGSMWLGLGETGAHWDKKNHTHNKYI